MDDNTVHYAASIEGQLKVCQPSICHNVSDSVVGMVIPSIAEAIPGKSCF
jgi:hypothetical protein